MQRRVAWKSVVCGMYLSLSLVVMQASQASLVSAGEITGRVMDKDGKSIANAVVFVHTLPEGMASPVPSEDTQMAHMDQIQEQFAPQVLPIRVGTQVRFPNRDQVHHHVYSFSKTKKFELPLYKGEETEPVLFDKPGVVKVGCNIHDWMSGVILVVPTPHYAMTDKSGQFTLTDLPDGTYAVASWHERSRTKIKKTIQQVRVGETAATFTLKLKKQRKRQPTRGVRGY
jgi:plastocyanin